MVTSDLYQVIQMRSRLTKTLVIVRINFRRLFPGKLLRSESVFYLVAVEFCFGGADYRHQRWEGNLANSLKVIAYLALFILQLFFIWKHLPLAASANPKMGTKRF